MHFSKIVLLIGLCSVCQLGTAQQQFAIRIQFSDKNATTFSLTEPSGYLSQRALDRRAKYDLGMDSSDLPVVSAYIDDVIQLSAGVLHTTSRWQNTCVVLMADTLSLELIRALPYVATTRSVGYYSDGLHNRPLSDSSATDQKPLGFNANYYGAAWEQIHLCRGEYLHEQGLMGAGMLIAVIDVGFMGVDLLDAFDSLRQDNRILDTRNFFEADNDVFQYSSHGSQALSCMAALLPETFVGTAPYAIYALYATDHLTTEQSIEEDNWVAAIERADSIGADLVSSSLGYNTFDNEDEIYNYNQLDGKTTLVAQAANKATAKGITVITSAGNEGNNAWHYLLTPGDADSALTIGAVDLQKDVAGFSSRGPNAAGTLKPDVAAMGVMASVVNGNGQIINQSGTSIATPVLAGLAACLLQAAPNTKPHQLRAEIRAAAHLHATPNNDVGHGVPDFSIAYNAITAIADPQQLLAGTKIYPNPAQNSFYISSSVPEGNQELHIVSLSGKRMMHKKLGLNAPQLIDVSQLPKGIYLLEVHIGSMKKVEKLVIR